MNVLSGGLIVSDVHDIVVCVADRHWTAETLHIASALARDSAANIVLVKPVPVDHPHWLGVDDAHWRYSEAERRDVDLYLGTLEDYGVPFSLYVYQYISFAIALQDLAEQLHPRIIFARLPGRAVPGWRRLERWRLRRQLARHDCLLYTLDNPLETLLWPPPLPRRQHQPGELEGLSHL